MSHFYLTTTLPYVNANPHIGFAQEIITADVIARHQRMLGKTVVFNTGTDEHGQKIYEKAKENGQTPQEYVDVWAQQFANLRTQLNLSYTHFIRTTDPKHKAAAQEFWKRCHANGDIYKKLYETAYCVGCELEKQASELENNKCPLHPNSELEIRTEENYFFKFSKYQEPLLNLYEANPEFVKPAGKLAEITAFVKSGLQDFSISRLKEKMSWGVPVPDDDEHVMYVWFDALVNYISTLGWPDETGEFGTYWPGIQLAGKDNLRQQAAMWQAMLMSAGVQSSAKILINGFISVDGQKMSKSLGNVIAPADMIAKYGVDATRFLLMSLGPLGNDMDVSWEKLDTTYTAVLSHSIGNTASRVAKLCELAAVTYDPTVAHWDASVSEKDSSLVEHASQELAHFEIKNAFADCVAYSNLLETKLSTLQPWKLTGAEQQAVLQTAVSSILALARLLQPFMPETAETLTMHFTKQSIAALQPLFPRIA